MTTNISLKPYPSGFLGSTNVTQAVTIKESDEKTILNQVFNRVSTSKVSPHSSAQELNKLWKTNLSGNASDESEFDFNEKVLILAKSIFGTDTFSQWLSVQSMNLEYTKEHHKFIDETINFIYYNVNRPMAFNNWITLLSGSVVETVTPKYTALQEKWLIESLRSDRNKINASMSIESLLLDWVRKDKGINDLLCTLYVLFGAR
jgi:hypothetical protein